MRRASIVLLTAALVLLPGVAAAQTLSPPQLVTTTLSTNVVHVSWSFVNGATAYDLYRKTGGAPFTKLLTLGSSSYTDSVPAGTTHYYQVVARNNTESVASNVDLATTIAFTDNPLVVGQTLIRDYHVLQLRTAVNYARAATGGLNPATWSHANLLGQPVYTEDIEELRANLNAARRGAGMLDAVFSDAPLVKNQTVIRKEHLKELRQAVKGVEPGGIYAFNSVAVSEPFFSPNGDGVKDATVISGRVTSTDSKWTVSIKSASTGAVVRTASGYGDVVSFSWNGRDNAGSVVPDGSYTYTLSATYGVYSASALTSGAVDSTAPTATLTSPTANQVISNVRQNGSTSLTASGSASDANFLSWDVAYGQNTSYTQFGTGTSAVSNGQFGVWNSSSSNSNGAYTVRLQVRDKAGNVGTANVNVTVAHFSATQNVYQIKPSLSEQITYTSVLPFAATETLTIRNQAGTTVRTLVNAARAAGTYNDVWNGRSDANAALPDGAYSYIVTVTEGSTTYTWDVSNQVRGSTATQYPYPSCSGRSMPLDTCENHGRNGSQYDPYTNDPLNIHYSVAEPSRVSVLLSTLSETPASCGGQVMCVVNQEYRAIGNYVDTWAGVQSSGLWDTSARPYITVVRRTDTFPKNVVLIDGNGPAVKVKNLLLTPTLYSPESGSMKIEFDLQTFAGTSATVTIQMIRQPDTVGMSTLQTVTLSNQTTGRISYTWDGKSVSGHWVSPGDYALVVTANNGGLVSAVSSRFVVIY